MTLGSPCIEPTAPKMGLKLKSYWVQALNLRVSNPLDTAKIWSFVKPHSGAERKRMILLLEANKLTVYFRCLKHF